jgi:methylenetetrahydrofolate dehydrogenase (NADP+)/methenyltetrahydrofolate cyclohydrolase
VDGLTEQSLGRLVRGVPGLVPCTPVGVMRLLSRYGVATSGKRAVVIGRSTLVGLPISLLLARKGTDATVTIAHSRSADLAAVCREADIIVAAAGQARMITVDHVKPGAAVIDVGISRSEAGMVGDVDFDAVQAVAGAITPMPRGTGPMTVACLMENTLTAARLQGAIPA